MNGQLVIIDYGVSNLGSIVNMLKRLAIAATVTSQPQDVLAASRIILPGVGAFPYAMDRLDALHLIDPLRQQVSGGTPLLGICLGMQLFSRRSEEGGAAGFGWLDAETVRFRFRAPANLPIPHMGWNDVTPAGSISRLNDGERDHRYYFAHSYHVVCRDPTDVVGTTTYGYVFPSIVGRGNLLGVQFHPEKSHRYGLALLRAFVTGTVFARPVPHDVASANT